MPINYVISTSGILPTSALKTIKFLIFAGHKKTNILMVNYGRNTTKL
jgi:hypothetical protein